MKTLSEYRVELGVKTVLTKAGEARNGLYIRAAGSSYRGVQIGKEHFLIDGVLTYRVFAEPGFFDKAVDMALDAGCEHYAKAGECIEDFDFEVLKVELVDTGIVLGASLA
jgi:hypothetical protein